MATMTTGAALTEMTDMPIVQVLISRITYMTAKKGVSVNQMLRESGLSKSLLDNMKRGSMPSADKLATLADYFGCSTDYLLGRIDTPEITGLSHHMNRKDALVYERISESESAKRPSSCKLTAEEVGVLRKLLKNIE